MRCHLQTSRSYAGGLEARRRAPGRAAARAPRLSCQAAAAAPSVLEVGVASVQGTSRKQNEDRYALDLDAAVAPAPYAAVFDGHGGFACAEWLAENLPRYVAKAWGEMGGAAAAEAAVAEAFLAADRRVLRAKAGLFGLGERGIGGAKCGSTAVAALVFEAGGRRLLLTANTGDARAILARAKGVVAQLSVDHVPDSEAERARIEAKNPNPAMPLVRFVGGTWRVGGLLALSRAFGDAHLKGTGQFEGVQAGGDGYSSGFGVVAEPTVTVTELAEGDRWLILASDGLYANPERGGGGGLENEAAVKLCDKLKRKSADEIAAALAAGAAREGSTDDVTVVLLRLGA
jgi:protein phosphatase 1L